MTSSRGRPAPPGRDRHGRPGHGQRGRHATASWPRRCTGPGGRCATWRRCRTSRSPGACATATHGSGDGNGNLATAVSAVRAGHRRRRPADAAPGHRPRPVPRGRRRPGRARRRHHAHARTSCPPSTSASTSTRTCPPSRSRGHFDEIFGSGVQRERVHRLAGPRHPPGLGQAARGRRRAPAAAAALAGCPARRRAPAPAAGHARASTPPQQLGVPGPWHERLPHFRPEFTPSAGEELQSEYLLPRGARRPRVRRAGQRSATCSRRCSRSARSARSPPDDLWLSPSYQRDTVALHFTWVKDPAAVAPGRRRDRARARPAAAPGRTGARCSPCRRRWCARCTPAGPTSGGCCAARPGRASSATTSSIPTSARTLARLSRPGPAAAARPPAWPRR